MYIFKSCHWQDFFIKRILLDTTILLSFIGATALLSISPGPDNIFVLIQSITNGVKYGIATVCGLISGCIVHTSLVAFGASAIIKSNENLYITLKIFGASYLVFLAYKVFKSDATPKITGSLQKEGNASKKSLGQLFRQGFIMNILNPKVSIFFLALFPGFLFSESMSTVSQFFVLGFIFMGVSLVIFSAIALLAGAIASKLRQNTVIGNVLKWLQITVFIGIAIFILFSD